MVQLKQSKELELFSAQEILGYHQSYTYLHLLSALVDQIGRCVIVDRYVIFVHERPSGRKIGTGTRRRGLWYMDRDESSKLEGSALVTAGEGENCYDAPL
jgi:hypothetical protein